MTARFIFVLFFPRRGADTGKGPVWLFQAIWSPLGQPFLFCLGPQVPCPPVTLLKDRGCHSSKLQAQAVGEGTTCLQPGSGAADPVKPLLCAACLLVAALGLECTLTLTLSSV